MTSAGGNVVATPAADAVGSANVTSPDGVVPSNGVAPTDADTSLAGEPGPVLVMLGVGNGTFKPPIRSWIAGEVLASGDFNGDKKNDLVVVTQSNDQVLVLQGNGDGRFRAAYPVGLSSNAPVNDAQPTVAQPGAPPVESQSDVAVSSAQSGLVAGFSPVPFNNHVTFALADDINGDSKLDLVIGSNPTFAKIYPGFGDFTFGAPVELVTGESPNDGVMADVNNDRKNLIVACRSGRVLSMFLNQGGLLFTAADLPLDRQAIDVAAADLNRDTKVDLVVAAASGGDGVTQFSEGFAYVLLGRGDGTFAEPVPYEVAPGSWQIVLGDFTGDGALDIDTANKSTPVQQPDGTIASSDTISILAGKSNGAFGAAALLPLGAPTGPSPDGGSVRSLSAADLNSDKTPDLAVSGGAFLLSRPANAKPAVKTR